MKMDALVLKRLQELESKAHAVNATLKQDDWGFRRIDHKLFHEWAISVMNLLNNIFGETSVHYQNFKQKYDGADGTYTNFEICNGIFRSAKDDYEGGYVFNLRSLVSIEVLDSVIEQAEQLMIAGYKDPAAVVIGIVLETSLKELCNRNLIPVGKLDRMNAELCKANLYSVGVQKRITAWADIRNNAAHGKWDQYKVEDVEDMKNGVNRFIADYL
ncbi:hypothetical protein ACX1C1_19730 [Paenibacillus sp. strain BS8-2]